MERRHLGMWHLIVFVLTGGVQGSREGGRLDRRTVLRGDECAGEVLERGGVGLREYKGVADLSHGAELWITGCWQVGYHEATRPIKTIYLLCVHYHYLKYWPGSRRVLA